MAARKKKNLVIVESPAKAKTINKYLGPDYEVVASKGHVRDLPKSRFGIDIDKGWVPTYRILQDRTQLIRSLKKQAAAAKTVYLAPDPDREGEAIAWHLKEALEIPEHKARRVTFNEITKSAVQKAFANAGTIDMDRVAAQEARRFLDRVVGYKLSPLLHKKVTRGLSAGRVQSVAVRLIVEREREIEAFKPEEYWKILAVLSPQGTLDRPDQVQVRIVKKKAAPVEENGEAEAPAANALPQGALQAELAEWAGEKFKAGSETDAGQIATALETADYVVARVEQKDRAERPSPPFTTSTLQQQASIRLHFSAKRTMMLAQRLYEGVELSGEGPVALITYMRTDSTRVSSDALQACREHIGKRYGDRYLPEKANFYAAGKSAQEAHEAIRPTDVAYTPEQVNKLMPANLDHRHELLRLYTLIWKRFVASQMTPAMFSITNVDIQAIAAESAKRGARSAKDAPDALGASRSALHGLFKAQGKILKFDGYRKVLPPGGKQEDALLPEVKEKQKLDLLDLAASQHFTQPPPRYSEASLVKALEKEGIGRPSTYAAIIEKIKDRGYVDLKERRFHATETGKIVTDLLVQWFPRVMDVKFTSRMEDDLDQIEERKMRRDDVLQEFWEPFRQELEVAEAKMEGIKGQETGENCPTCGKPLVLRYSKKTHRSFAGCSGYPECTYIKPGEGEEPPEMTEHNCPACGKPMVKRMGKRGPFLACSGYPACKTTMNFDAEGKPVLSARPTEHVCEKCGQPMVLREGKRGPFLACSGFPKCRNAKDVDAQGNPLNIDLGIACEKCGAPMKVRRGPRGPFLGCSAFPKCRSTKQIPDDLKGQLAKILPPPPKRPPVPSVEVNETCPDCGGPMKLRPGRRGFFLGCAKYPKCKGTREAPPEVLEQIQAGVS